MRSMAEYDRREQENYLVLEAIMSSRDAIYAMATKKAKRSAIPEDKNDRNTNT